MGGARVDVRLGEETVWPTQSQMAKVFRTSTDNASLHLKNIFFVIELEESATIEDFSVVQTDHPVWLLPISRPMSSQ